MPCIIIKTFTKACRKRRFLPALIKMAYITKLLAAKRCNTPFSFLGNQSGNRSRKNNGIVIGIINLIYPAVMLITVLF